MASNRQYLTQAELAEFADITISNAGEADDQISQAEELIDQFVGFQNKAVKEVVEGKVSAVSGNTFTLETRHQNVYQQDYFVYCWVEIIGGTGIGQRKQITASTYAGVITHSAFSPALSTDSIYRIWQLGKFPRHKDSFYYSTETPTRYYKHVPEAVKRATAAQVHFMIEMGKAYFATLSSQLSEEEIGDYRYAKFENSSSGLNNLIAPKAKLLLRGIINHKGQMIVDDKLF